MYNKVSEWLDNVLKQDILEEVSAFCFNLYDDSDENWSMELIGTEHFDIGNEEWSCDEITDFGTREGLLVWNQSVEWDKVFEEMVSILKEYLENGEYKDVLKARLVLVSDL